MTTKRDRPSVPFGGITVVFGGDFHQTLPVVPKALRQAIVGASIARSPLWHQIEMQKVQLMQPGCWKLEQAQTWMVMKRLKYLKTCAAIQIHWKS